MRIRLKERQEHNKYGFVGGLSLLLSPFAKILSASLLAGMLASAGVNVYQLLKIKNLEIRLLETENESGRLISEVATCKNALDNLNKDILRIRVDAEEDVNMIKDVNEQLGEVAKIQKNEIDRLKMKAAPISCDEARDWLRENINVYE